MDPPTIVALLSEAAAQLREDLELMETGVIKCECFGTDVTEQHKSRMALRLAKIEAVIDAHRDSRCRFGHSPPLLPRDSHPAP